MPGWLPSALFTLTVGIIGFFLKRTMKSFEDKMAEQREDFHKEMESIRKDFKESMDTLGHRVERLEDTISEMPYKYTLKEDFIRSMSAVDKKLDLILENQHERREIKT